ncbi:MAG: hypothetical protein AAGI34_10110 [Pseudomonadota bacterium]
MQSGSAIASALGAALALGGGFASAEDTPAKDTPGLIIRSIDAPHHGRPMQVTLWYPAAPGGTPIVYGDNPVFYGVAAREDAPLAEGRYPLVLMSHGLGGAARALSWLGAGLAEAGAVVLAVDHPNTTFRDFDLIAGLDHWTRTQDFAAAQAALSTKLAPVLTAERYAIGFSYGGWTALSLGGLRGARTGMADYCAEVGAASQFCTQLQEVGIDLGAIDAERWEASYRDEAVSAVLAIDPGLTQGIDAALAAETIPEVAIVTLGTPEQRLGGTDVSAAGSGLLAHLPEAEHRVIAPAMHFSAMPLCKPRAVAILIEENDDPVCSDPQGTERAAIHAEIIALAIAHFGLGE